MVYNTTITTPDAEHLVIDLPGELRSRRVKVTLEPDDTPLDVDEYERALNEAREKLRAAGLLSETKYTTGDPPENAEDHEWIELEPGSPTMEQIIDEGRGER
jgi:hypothetical protein